MDGLTCGALSLMGDPFWREGFGPMLRRLREDAGSRPVRFIEVEDLMAPFGKSAKK